MRLPFGTGYIRIKDIRTPPPRRFAPGERVDTPYGKGIVRELRASESHVDYVVDLIENTLSGAAPTAAAPTGGLVRVDSMYEGAASPSGAAAAKPAAPTRTRRNCAVAYMNPADVKPRTSRSADETLDDAADYRTKGNDAFKVRGRAAGRRGRRRHAHIPRRAVLAG